VKSPPTNYPAEFCLSDDLTLNINAVKPHRLNSVPFDLAAVINKVEDFPPSIKGIQHSAAPGKCGSDSSPQVSMK
jgi:hypothetical protein